jgi:hypothetical protein
MTTPTVLVATWDNGLFVLTDRGVHHELPGQSVRGLVSDGRGDALAILRNASLYRRARDGEWTAVAEGEFDLACCVALGSTIYAGTNDAQVLRVREGATFERLSAFEEAPGRCEWYAGTAVVDGRVVGPPLGVRSMTATCDHAAILVNVHVGGIPRSHDGGATWQPTIDIDCDVHQVCAHPTRPMVVAAAAAVGLCLSRDGGLTWNCEQQGLHAPYCSAVAFAGDDVLVSASVDPFVSQGAVYRRSLEASEPMLPVGGGLPRWTDGRVDTSNIAASGSAIAVADQSGNLYLSVDAGRAWTRVADHLATPSSVFVY